MTKRGRGRHPLLNTGWLQGVLDRVAAAEWLEFADAQREKLLRSFSTHREDLIHEARSHLSHLARHTHGVLDYLRIPTRRDLTRLERKLHRIETRLDAIRRPSELHHPPPTTDA